MFEKFISTYRSDAAFEQGRNDVVAPTLNEFLKAFGGESFNNGIYRVFSAPSIERWNDLISYAFPKFRAHANCFAVDWLGRIFALDDRRLERGAAGVVMFEPGTGDALEIPCNILSFHEEELVDYREEALAESFYRNWISCGGAAPSETQCVGYKRPLFLGGADTVQNLEISDLEVYWEISSKLIQTARDLAVGTAIGSISIGP
jgi:hypothetical protein